VIATIAVIAVVAWLLLAEPLLGRRAFRQLLAALDKGEAGVRVRFYRQWTWQGWLVVGITLLVSWIQGWTPAQLGFAWPHSTGLVPAAMADGIIGGVIAGLVLGPIALWLVKRSKRAGSSVPPEADKPRKSRPEVLRMFPQSSRERAWFAALAITAGIGEEVVWRGFGLCVLFACHIHGPTALLVAMLAIPFGWAHLYQGVLGVVSTAILGAVFSILYLATGSLLLPVILHALFDLRLLLMRFDLQQEGEAQGRSAEAKA
jgi:uncharacterized protein